MVTDPLDIASDLAEIYNQAALENHKSKTRTDKESAFFCIDYDEVIPHARRAGLLTEMARHNVRKSHALMGIKNLYKNQSGA